MQHNQATNNINKQITSQTSANQAHTNPNSTESNVSNHIVTYLREYMNQRIIGQAAFVDRLLLALFADGHVLLEGAPGLAKTKAVNTLSSTIDCNGKRIQFTPDLLPSDLTGTDIYRPETGEFIFQAGPLFNNMILADEINRAPAKVQSALLEAMAEKQVTVGGKTYKLPKLFMVMATQNPIEQEGTYPLPEAQLDRFLLHVNIDYPDINAEREILRIVRDEAAGVKADPENIITEQAVFDARQAALKTHVSDALIEYILQLVQATRKPEVYDASLANMIAYGASPRSSIALDRCVRVYAWMNGADYATPADVHAIVHDVLRHRIILTFEAEAEGKTTDDVIDALLRLVPVV